MRKIYAGFTTIGLLMSISLSSILLLSILKFFQLEQYGNRIWQQRLLLQSDFQLVLQTIGCDIRRAGFRGIAKNESNLSLFEQMGDLNINLFAHHSVKPDCILFFYDRNISGCLGKNSYKCINKQRNNTKELNVEFFGYRLHHHNIEMLTSGINDRCIGAECRNFIQTDRLCQPDKSWTTMLERGKYQITEFTFDWFAERKDINLHLSGRLLSNPLVSYETNMIVPLLNQGALSD